MAFGTYEEVQIKATGEKASICRGNGNDSFHIQTGTENYVKCYLVEIESTGEIRSYRETALQATAG